MKKISFQKLFCFISVLFILSCCIFYGTRFVKYYLASKKIEISEKNSLAKVLKENNSDKATFKQINNVDYFTDNNDTNYLLYSGLLWRIIKVNNDNSLVAISNNSLTSLAFTSTNFNSSPIFNWLNKSDKEYSGILENSLNKPEEYLTKTEACLDKIDELSNTPCKEVKSNNYFSLLSVVDYLNIGSKDSYLNNSEYFYLNNNNTEGKIWYVNDEGRASLNTGNDIIGVRPIITIKANVDYVAGEGTKEKPYTIEKENGLFGSYVKLDNTIWRIYKVNDTEVRLILNDYLKVNGKNVTYKYSDISSYHDDYKYGSVAYYLNHNFLDTLSYKNKIKEVSWSNGYYNSTSNYDYTNALKSTIDSKVALLSIGDIYLNPELTNYSTMTGSMDKGKMIYNIQKDKKTYVKNISIATNVVPAISIDKDLLTKGNGTIDSPFEME